MHGLHPNAHRPTNERRPNLKAGETLEPSMQDVQFAYWIPNATGVSVPSVLPPQATFEYNQWLATAAEEMGFDFAVAQPRSARGASQQLDPLALSSALAAVTNRIGLIASIYPGLWHPEVAAKALTTIDIVSGGRAGLNVVAASVKEEFTSYGELLDYDEHYRKAEDLIRTIRDVLASESAPRFASLYAVDGAALPSKPTRRKHPPIFQSGNSCAARRIAAKAADWYVFSGNKPDILSRQIEEIRGLAVEAGRDPHAVRFGVSALVIVRDTEREAKAELRDLSSRSHEGLDAGMQAFSDYSDSFKTGLIGTEDQVLERIEALKAIGVDLIVAGFLDYTQELPLFGHRIIRAEDDRMPRSRSVDPAIRQALGLGG